MIEVREARYFIAVAEELHFGRAAERLHMSQPPLSQAIKTLESRLGVQLLHRSTREVRLSTAGSTFLEQCRALVGAATAAEEAARQAASGQLGQLRIAAVTSAFIDPLPRILADLRQARPLVETRLEEVDTHQAVPALRRREIDIALVRQLATPADCARVSLRTERFVLAIPAAWAERTEQPADLASAATLPWVWLPRSISPDYHDQVVACCRAADVSPDARHVARSITSQLAMVACGLGVALVPASAAGSMSGRADTATRFFPLPDSATIELAAVWLRADDALVDGFLTSARRVLGTA